jgi:hypothetical protein
MSDYLANLVARIESGNTPPPHFLRPRPVARFEPSPTGSPVVPPRIGAAAQEVVSALVAADPPQPVADIDKSADAWPAPPRALHPARPYQREEVSRNALFINGQGSDDEETMQPQLTGPSQVPPPARPVYPKPAPPVAPASLSGVPEAGLTCVV